MDSHPTKMSEKVSPNISDSNMTFVENNAPLPVRHSGVLFNSREFLQIDGKRQILNLGYESKGVSALNITFDIKDNQATSLPGCPYSGVVFLAVVTPSDFNGFLRKVCQHLKARGVEEILIKQSPVFAWDRLCSGADETFIEAGFEQAQVEINHHIPLGQSDYLSSIHSMQRRKIKKCMEHQLIFKEEKHHILAQAHQFIEHCRNQQGLPVNISLGQLAKTVETLPNYYRIFTIRNQKNSIIAATITVKISDSIVYNYLPAFDREYKVYSPLTLLTFQLHERLGQEGFKYLDLGISSIEGKPQKNLITFKQRMGAIASRRVVYYRKL